MKKYKIIPQDNYTISLRLVLSYGRQEYGINATRQFSDGIRTLIKGLADFPETHATAPGSEEFPNKNIREIIYKNHRVIYQIAGDEIHILAIYNCRQSFDLQGVAI